MFWCQHSPSVHIKNNRLNGEDSLYDNYRFVLVPVVPTFVTYENIHALKIRTKIDSLFHAHGVVNFD